MKPEYQLHIKTILTTLLIMSGVLLSLTFKILIPILIITMLMVVVYFFIYETIKTNFDYKELTVIISYKPKDKFYFDYCLLDYKKSGVNKIEDVEISDSLVKSKVFFHRGRQYRNFMKRFKDYRSVS